MRNIANETKITDSPRLAVFWYVDGEFIGSSACVDDVAVVSHNNGSMKCLDIKHEDVWKQYRIQAGCDENVGYDYYPRGRIIFLTNAQKYKVFLDSRYRKKRDVCEKVLRFYHLPQDTIFADDPNYESQMIHRECLLPEGIEPASRSELGEKWKAVYEEYRDDEKLDVDAYKILFIRTWKYFMDHVRDEKWIDGKDMGILSSMAAFAEGNFYPKGVRHSVFEGCTSLAKGMVQQMEHLDAPYGWEGFFDGILTVNLGHFLGECRVDFHKFEASFQTLCEILRGDDEEDGEE